MIVFGVDSSAAAGSAAAVRDGEILYEAYANEGLTHRETLLVRCDEVFRSTGIEPEQVDCFAVTAGPGSFTGLRIGLGLVKGMAFVRKTPCVPVSTFDALAWPLAERNRDLVCVLDARQKRVYCCAYRIADGKPVRAGEPQILPLAELAKHLKDAGISDPLIAGDAAPMVAAVLPDAEEAGEAFRYVHAGEVARIAEVMYRRGEYVLPNELRPVYLQLSQAERERKRKLEGKDQ